MHRSSIALIAVLLFSLAGCSGLLGSTAEQAPEFAPGVTAERVENASQLADATRKTLQQTSYTYVSNGTQRIVADGYHYTAEHDTRVWVSADGAFRYHHHGVVNGSGAGSNFVDGVWTNGTAAVARTVNVDNESVTYTRYRPPEPFSARNATQAGVATALQNGSVSERWNESGTEFARVRTTESQTRRTQAGNGSVVNATTTRNATATVRADGFVSALDASVSGQRPLPAAAANESAGAERPLARTVDTSRVRYSALGSTTVTKPAWVETALEATEDLTVGERTRPQPIDASA